MLKVMTIVGTRPEIIRLFRTISKLDQYCEHILVHTGQNFDYELNGVFFKEMGIRNQIFSLVKQKNATDTIGQVIISCDKILEKECPDAILILGDTNSSLSLFQQSEGKYLYFIWKRVIDVLICVCQRKLIGK